MGCRLDQTLLLRSPRARFELVSSQARVASSSLLVFSKASVEATRAIFTEIYKCTHHQEQATVYIIAK